MSLLTSARTASVKRIGAYKCDLQAGVKVFRRGLAAVKAGYVGPSTGDPTEIILGNFTEDVDNSSGGAGSKQANVDYFRVRTLFLLDNDTGAALTKAQREQPCSVLDDHTATQFTPANGSSMVFHDLDAVTGGVWVELVYPSSPDDAGVPAIQKGTTTLVAGTKTVTGVKLTATSQILLSMKDPGAGSITAFAALDAPAASRNTATGQFVINAINDSAAVLTTAVCTVDYLILG